MIFSNKYTIRFIVGIVLIFITIQLLSVNIYAQQNASSFSTTISNNSQIERINAERIADKMLLLEDSDATGFEINTNPEADTNNENPKYMETEIIIKSAGESNQLKRLEVPEDSNIRETLISAILDDDIQYAQPNYIYTSTAWTDNGTESYPSDYNASNHWYYEQSDLLKLWKQQNCPGGGSCGGDQNITVAIIDTGLSYRDFSGITYDDSGPTEVMASFIENTELSSINLHNNADEIPDDGFDNDNNGYVDDVVGVDTFAKLYPWTVPNQTNAELKEGVPVDTYGHGDYVASIIAGSVDNGSSISPSFNTSIMPIAANFHYERSFSTLSLVFGVNYAVQEGADVINMSLGGTVNDFAFRDSLVDAYNSGVVLVASSGNDGTGSINYPALYEEVIAVGSVNSNNTRASYSNYGSELDVVAYVGQGGGPGNATWQSSLSCFGSCSPVNIDDGHSTQFGIGTSYAAPQVAALAALILADNNSLTPYQVTELIRQSTTDIGSAGFDNLTGFGVIDFDKFLTLDTPPTSPPVPPTPSTSPVYRFWSPDNEAHFFTINQTEKNIIENTYPDNIWTYEGVAYNASTSNYAELSPIYRFWSPDNETHFYTISSAEKDLIINSYPSNVWTYEGIAYYAATGNISDTKPLYRFWSARNEAHFYTVSSEEKNILINEYDDFTWKYEGIAYYVY